MARVVRATGRLSRRAALEASAARWCERVRRIRWLRAALLHPLVARPGYAIATAVAWVWGAALLLGPVERRGGVVICRDLPPWAFGRAGTTIGAMYLTSATVGDAVLRHEAVHRAQWRRYGLAFIPLYLAAGEDARTNRFEIEAGLTDGGYS